MNVKIVPVNAPDVTVAEAALRLEFERRGMNRHVVSGPPNMVSPTLPFDRVALEVTNTHGKPNRTYLVTTKEGPA